MAQAQEEDPMASVFAALTVGLSEEQVTTLRRLVTAHVTFLAGLLQAAGPERER